jgi:hypothetical protein
MGVTMTIGAGEKFEKKWWAWWVINFRQEEKKKQFCLPQRHNQELVHNISPLATLLHSLQPPILFTEVIFIKVIITEVISS